ncbi:YihY family inner membrane protein [Helicobacter cetorum]|uniref:Putative ribonuclease N n=1 Tax=Helicobacter cetorum (strain ATCC BAA-540 / CCUG 52418 / MIT 99-5656) TaxID=1163745 RepID=I0ESR8_HELCM|nr:YihY family inner membrane protein [Helicobacter cetorum]AFI05987.1 putative ribonuclease N [Helicobacter cetorum MIT 99-5656]
MVFLKEFLRNLRGFFRFIKMCFPLRLKNALLNVSELFYYASSLSFYTILSLSPILLFVFSLFVSTYMQAHTGEVEALIFPNAPKLMGAIKDFLETFKKTDMALGMLEAVSILVALVLFCENYRSIASKIFQAKPRDYIYCRGKEIFLFWGFGTTLVFVVALPLVVFFDIKIQVFFDDRNSSLLHVLRWLGTYAFFLILFTIPTNKVFNHRFWVFLWVFFTSIFWHVLKWAFTYYVLYNRTYHELYGSVSILWFLMSWVYVSWLVILMGMYGCKMCDKYEPKRVFRGLLEFIAVCHIK